MIELVAPINEKSPIVKILEKNSVTPYHICYEVDEINGAILELRRQKYVMLFDPVESVALDNKKICYLYNKDVGLIEIVQK